MENWQTAHGVQWQTDDEHGMVLQLLEVAPLANLPPIVAVKGERDRDGHLVRHHFLSPNAQSSLDIDVLVRVIQEPENDFLFEDDEPKPEISDNVYELIIRVLDSETWPEELEGRTIQVKAGDWGETAVTDENGEILVHMPKELLDQLTINIQ